MDSNAWVVEGIALAGLEEYEKALKAFDKALEIYAQYMDAEDIETAHLLREMAEIYVAKDQLEEAENFINRSLKILQDRNHVEAYKSLETLGEIYVTRALDTQDGQASQHLTTQALDTFHQALKITAQNFPETSVHIQRIQSKIKIIEKQNF